MTIKVINVMAISLDGKISVTAGETDKARDQIGFTNEADKELVIEQIKLADAVILGANSARGSGGLIAQKNHKNIFPKWFVFSNSGMEDCTEFWDQANIARCLVSQNPINIPADVENITYLNNSPARFLMDYLSRQNDIERVLLFGGGQINRMFYSEKLVDELKITICPFVLGGLNAPNFVDPGIIEPTKLLLNSSHVQGDHVFLSYTIQKD